MLCLSYIEYCASVCGSSDKADDDLEMTMVCHRPEGLDQLEAQTNFSKRELQVLYRGFKNVSDCTGAPQRKKFFFVFLKICPPHRYIQ